MMCGGIISPLPPLAPRTSAIECGLSVAEIWGNQTAAAVGSRNLPTPSAGNFNEGEHPSTWLERRERLRLTAQNGNGAGMPLAIAAQLLPTPRAAPSFRQLEVSPTGNRGRSVIPALLPSPTAADKYPGPGQNQQSLGRLAVRGVLSGLGMLPTPRASPNENRQLYASPSQEAGVRGMSLAVSANLLATPTARDWRSGKASAQTHSRGARPLGEQIVAVEVDSAGGGEITGYLNPSFVEWMMGLPDGWTDV